jgi:hypothetical protein
VTVPTSDAPSLPVRIVGTELPGRRFGEYEDVHVGVQRGREAEQLVPADRAEAVFDLVLTPVAPGEARGPFAQGRRGERFLYLVWAAGPDRTMFRRLKLMLDDVPPDVWEAACRPRHRLEARLGLTDDCGGPLCARVVPPKVTWRAARAR